MFNTKKEISIGAEIPVNILSKDHHKIKHEFENILLDVEQLDEQLMSRLFRNFGKYNIYVKSPKWANVYNAKDSQKFVETIQFYKNLLRWSKLMFKGVVIDLGHFKGLNPGYVDGVFKHIFLKKIIYDYTRRGKEIIFRNTATSFTDAFTLSYILDIIRTSNNKGLKAGLDVHNSHYLNARFLKEDTTLQDLGRLKKEFSYVFLSGIGKKKERTGIFDCSVYPEHSYVNLIKGLKDSVFFLEYRNSMLELVEEKNRIKKLIK